MFGDLSCLVGRATGLVRSLQTASHEKSPNGFPGHQGKEYLALRLRIFRMFPRTPLRDF